MGSLVLPNLPVVPMNILFTSLIKLFIIFISVVETLVIVSGGWSGWVIFKMYCINPDLYEPNLFYGDGRFLLVKHLLHNILHRFLNLRLLCMELWSLVKIHCINHFFFPCFFCIHCGSGSYLMWRQYKKKYFHVVKNTGGLWVLNFQPHRFQGVQLY